MKRLFTLFGFALLLFLFTKQDANAQLSNLWKYTGSLKPVVNTWRVDFPAGASGSGLFTLSGYRNCNLETTSSGMVICGVDGGGVSSGGIIGIGDGRYVLTAGDTMTGALVIQNGNTHSFTATPLLNVRGTMSGQSLRITGTGSTPLIAMNLGKSFVGIGTTTPTANLQIVSNTGTVLQVRSYSNGASAGVPSVLSLYSAGGTAASPSATVGTDGGTKPSIWQIKFQGRDNVGDTTSAAEIRATAGCSGCNGVWGAGGHSTALEFYTTPTNSTTLTKAMTIGQDGAINFNVSGFSFPASGTFSPPGNIVMSGGKGVIYTHPSIGTVGFSPMDGSVIATHIAGNDVRIDIDSDNNGSVNYFIVGQDHSLTATNTTTEALFYISGSGATVIGRSTVIAGKKAELEVIGTASGRTVYAQQALRSSGSLVWEGAASGATLYLGGKLEGAGLTDCDTGASSKLLWDATTGRFSCGTDADTNTTYTAGQGLQLNSTSFRLLSSFTGSVIQASTTLASSGTLIFEGAASGSSLYLGTSLEGAGLISCSNGTTSKLLWNSTTKRFSCGTDTDTNTTYTAGQGLTLSSTSFRTNSILTGSLVSFTTVSGSVVKAKNTLASSGSIVAEGTISGAYVTATEISPRWFQIQAFASGSSLTTGSGVGAFHFQIPVSMSGWNVVSPQATVDKAGVTNTTTFQLRNREKRRKILSTPCSIDSTESGTLTAAAGCTIDTAADDVGGGDHIYLDIPSISTTAPKGLNFMFGLRKP